MFNRRELVSVLAAAFMLCTLVPTAGREWSDITGRFKREAEFVGLKDGSVHLKKPDGQVIVVPLERLSVADREYARRAAQPPKQASTPEKPLIVAPGIPVPPELPKAASPASRTASDMPSPTSQPFHKSNPPGSAAAPGEGILPGKPFEPAPVPTAQEESRPKSASSTGGYLWFGVAGIGVLATIVWLVTRLGTVRCGHCRRRVSLSDHDLHPMSGVETALCAKHKLNFAVMVKMVCPKCGKSSLIPDPRRTK